MRIAASIAVAIGVAGIVACGGGGGGKGWNPQMRPAANAPAPAPAAAPAQVANLAPAQARPAVPIDAGPDLAELARQDVEPAIDDRKPSEVLRDEAAEQARADRAKDVELNNLAANAAYQLAKMALGEVLKSPSAAKFDRDVAATDHLPIGVGISRVRRWVARGKVQAPNSFGVMIRGDWRMELIHAEGDFRAVTFWFDDQQLYQDEKYVQLVKHAIETDAAAEKELKKAERLDRAAAAKEKADSRSDEEKAEAMLRNARALLAGNKKAAKKRFQEIVDKFPDTDAASKAAASLEHLP